MALSSMLQEAYKLQQAQLAAGVKPASVKTTKVSRTPTPAAKPTPTPTTKPTQQLSPTLQAAYAAQEAQLAAGVKPATVETTKVQTTAPAPTVQGAQEQLSPTLQAAYAAQEAQLAAGVQPATVDTTFVATSESAVLESFAGLDYTVDAPTAFGQLLADRQAEMQQAASMFEQLLADRRAEMQQAASMFDQLLIDRRAEMQQAAAMLPWNVQQAPQPATQPAPQPVYSAPDGYTAPSGNVDPFAALVQQIPPSYSEIDGADSDGQTIDPSLADTPPESGSLASIFTPQRVLLLTAFGLLTGIWLVGSN